jgi:type I restriction enzyme M protein
VTLRDGTKSPGLFAYLRSLQSATGRDRKDVIRQVFNDVSNRMISGALLRDVVNKVNDIHFDNSEEVNILSNLYESMLKEMRDAAGDSGEFYTPRPVVIRNKLSLYGSCQGGLRRWIKEKLTLASLSIGERRNN